MKYNDDIEPVVKEIGLILEKELNPSTWAKEYKWAAVDKAGDVYVYTEKPYYHNSIWDSNYSFNVVDVTFPLPILNAIEYLWEKCLFQLGAKSE